MPVEYEDAFVCDALKIPYTVLEQQPAEWVDQIISYLSIRTEYEQNQRKVEEARAKIKQKRL